MGCSSSRQKPDVSSNTPNDSETNNFFKVKDPTEQKKIIEDSPQPQFLSFLSCDTLPNLPSTDIRYADLPSTYSVLTAAEKQSILWKNISRSPYDFNSLPTSTDPLATAYLLNPLYLMTTFTLESDAVPGGRKKVFYPFGAAAKVTFKTSGTSPFSGIFKTGALGIIRFSLSAPVTSATDIATPAIALKLLIDGKSSQNLFAFNSAEGTTDRNFFGKEFSTAAGKPHQASALFGDVFIAATALLPRRVRPVNSEVLPTNVPASVTSSGDAVDMEGLIAPYKVIFTPSEEVANLMESTDLTDFRIQLSWMPPMATLYKVSACMQDQDSVRFPLGDIVLDSPIVASKYADEYLFFQHPLFRP